MHELVNDYYGNQLKSTVLTAHPTSAAICRRLSPCFLKTLISTYTSSLIIKATKKP